MIKFNLRQLLFDRKMNQADLSRLSKVRSNTVNAYFHGYIKRMNVEDVEKICLALNCTIEEFMEIVPH